MAASEVCCQTEAFGPGVAAATGLSGIQGTRPRGCPLGSSGQSADNFAKLSHACCLDRTLPALHHHSDTAFLHLHCRTTSAGDSMLDRLT